MSQLPSHKSITQNADSDHKPTCPGLPIPHSSLQVLRHPTELEVCLLAPNAPLSCGKSLSCGKRLNLSLRQQVKSEDHSRVEGIPQIQIPIWFIYSTCLTSLRNLYQQSLNHETSLMQLDAAPVETYFWHYILLALLWCHSHYLFFLLASNLIIPLHLRHY